MPQIVGIQFIVGEPQRVSGAQLHAVVKSWLGPPERGGWRLAGWEQLGSDRLVVGIAFPEECPQDGTDVLGLAGVLEARMRASLMTPNQPNRLGRQSALAAPIGFDAGSPNLVRTLDVSGWGEFESLRGVEEWEWAFLTPTTFSAGGRSRPVYDPVQVLERLHAHLYRAAGPTLTPRMEFADLREVTWVAFDDVDIHMQEVIDAHRWVALRRAKMGYPLLAFQGAARHRLIVKDPAKTPPVQDELARLLRFAEFSGVGSHTAYGMGHVRVSMPRTN